MAHKYSKKEAINLDIQVILSTVIKHNQWRMLTRQRSMSYTA